MYYLEFAEIISEIISNRMNKESLLNYLLNNFDCIAIYNSEDDLVTDTYFSLKHYASGEEKIEKEEWEYLAQCLKGERQFSFQEKMSILTKPSSDEKNDTL